MGRFVWGVAVFATLAGLYLFLAGTVDAVELTAMAICAGAGTAMAIALEDVAKRNYLLMPPPKAILRPLLALLPELLLVGRELVAAIVVGPSRQRGEFTRQPFEPGGDDPRAAARRALTVIGVSLAPRTFVVRGELSDHLLTHGLPPKPPSPDRVWPA